MKFIADDGKIFDTMDECEEYEKVQGDGKEVAMLWHKFITVYDEDGKVIETTFDWDQQTKDYLYYTSNLVCDEAFFVRINCSASDWEKITNYFSNEYGTYLPHYEKDVFRCMEDGDWVSFNVEAQRLIERWKSVKHVTIMSKRR